MGGTWDFPFIANPRTGLALVVLTNLVRDTGRALLSTARTASSCRWVAKSTSVCVQARCLTLTNWARDCRLAGRYTARHHDVNKFHRPTVAGDVGDDAAASPASPTHEPIMRWAVGPDGAGLDRTRRGRDPSRLFSSGHGDISALPVCLSGTEKRLRKASAWTPYCTIRPGGTMYLGTYLYPPTAIHSGQSCV